MTRYGRRPVSTSNCKDARAFCGFQWPSGNATDLVILDLNLPDMNGLDVLAQLIAVNPAVSVIMLTGQADLETAVEAMRAGAENFLPKPVDIQHLKAAADRAYEKVELRRRTTYLEDRAREQDPKPKLGGRSTAMTEFEEKSAPRGPQ